MPGAHEFPSCITLMPGFSASFHRISLLVFIEFSGQALMLTVCRIALPGEIYMLLQPPEKEIIILFDLKMYRSMYSELYII